MEKEEILATFTVQYRYEAQGYTAADLDDLLGDLPDPTAIAEAIAALVESRFDVEVTNAETGDLGGATGKL